MFKTFILLLFLVASCSAGIIPIGGGGGVGGTAGITSNGVSITEIVLADNGYIWLGPSKTHGFRADESNANFNFVINGLETLNRINVSGKQFRAENMLADEMSNRERTGPPDFLFGLTVSPGESVVTPKIQAPAGGALSLNNSLGAQIAEIGIAGGAFVAKGPGGLNVQLGPLTVSNELNFGDAQPAVVTAGGFAHSGAVVYELTHSVGTTGDLFSITGGSGVDSICLTVPAGVSVTVRYNIGNIYSAGAVDRLILETDMACYGYIPAPKSRWIEMDQN